MVKRKPVDPLAYDPKDAVVGAAYERGTDASEFCWGAGLTVPGYEDSDYPVPFGRYHGTPGRDYIERNLRE